MHRISRVYSDNERVGRENILHHPSASLSLKHTLNGYVEARGDGSGVNLARVEIQSSPATLAARIHYIKSCSFTASFAGVSAFLAAFSRACCSATITARFDCSMSTVWLCFESVT